MSKIRVELLRSFSGKTKRQRDSARGLGLRKRHQSVVVDDTPTNRGMINKISHMVRVEEVDADEE
ncbi:MAG: 50S ribosomal protein L30 [Myxococcota bacterium]